MVVAGVEARWPGAARCGELHRLREGMNARGQTTTPGDDGRILEAARLAGHSVTSRLAEGVPGASHP